MERESLLEVQLPGGETFLCKSATLVRNDGSQVSVDSVAAIKITGGVLSLVRPDQTSLIPLGKFRQIDFDGLIAFPVAQEGIDSARLLRESPPMRESPSGGLGA